LSAAPACPQVVFVHLPKTGGMSLHLAMERALGPGRVLRVGDAAAQAAFLRMGRDEMARYAFVSGHFTLNEALARALPEARFVTVLRDPVARLLSAFNYMATWPQHPRHAAFRDKGFAAFVAEAGHALSGEACRQLTGTDHAFAATPLLDGCYAAVAVPERLQELANLVAAWLGVPPPELAQENPTPGQGRITLDSATCERLLALTQDDRSLHAHVAALHHGLLVAPGLSL
jgi:hypothetical protein